MSRSKDKGTKWETAVVRYLRCALAENAIDRTALHGTGDIGDIAGVTAHGSRVAVQCKAANRFRLSEWLDETGEQRDRYGALAGALIVKRPNYGDRHMADQYVLMSLADFAALCTGIRPEDRREDD